ncbi:hypothetical protein TNCV_4852601 [Trichonephila clavipes]|nr:hypothetical protein TNCV_4852601 [Trichonephila clavipes]
MQGAAAFDNEEGSGWSSELVDIPYLLESKPASMDNSLKLSCRDWSGIYSLVPLGLLPTGKTSYCGTNNISHGRTQQEWGHVLFRDELRFLRQSNSRRVFTWRENEALFYLTKIDRFVLVSSKHSLCVVAKY